MNNYQLPNMWNLQISILLLSVNHMYSIVSAFSTALQIYQIYAEIVSLCLDLTALSLVDKWKFIISANKAVCAQEHIKFDLNYVNQMTYFKYGFCYTLQIIKVTQHSKTWAWMDLNSEPFCIYNFSTYIMLLENIFFITLYIVRLINILMSYLKIHVNLANNGERYYNLRGIIIFLFYLQNSATLPQNLCSNLNIIWINTHKKYKANGFLYDIFYISYMKLGWYIANSNIVLL